MRFWCMFSLSHKSWVPDDCMSKRISISRERVAAAIEPHVLAALTWAVVGHAGGAPRWSYDLAALNPVCLRLTADWCSSADARSSAAFVGSLVGCRWYRECRHEQ